jgi:hypothetical protein
MPERSGLNLESNEQLFWEQVDREFANLCKDAMLWECELNERAEWESTLIDGLGSLED